MKFAVIVTPILVQQAAAVGQRFLRGSVLESDDLVTNGGVASLNFGKPSCQCIGLQGTMGLVNMHLGNYSDGSSPSEVGSYCKAWDADVDPACKEPGPGKEWCGQPWCFVDACHCQGIAAPPKVDRRLPEVAFQGMPLYYSYATCGGEDVWSEGHNPMECSAATTKEDCTHQGKGDDCTWGETPWGPKCLGWEAAGMCTGLPEESPWGKSTCPCVGFIGLNGTITAHTHHGPLQYPADLGSVCQAWDMNHDPDCSGEHPAEGCDQKWCFVDPVNCNVEAKPLKADYLPEASWHGHPLHFSYATCGGVAPGPGHHTSLTNVVSAAVQQPHKAEDDDDDEEEHDDDDDDHDEDDDDDDDKPHHLSAKGGLHSGAQQVYDLKAYKEGWGEEWAHGKPPAFRDQHPWVRQFEDRQSDGKASPVEEIGFHAKVEEAEEAPGPDEAWKRLEDCPHCVGLKARKSAAPTP